jgi:hypothetical protein
VKKTKDIRKLTLRQEMIRILTSAELKTVIGGAENGTCNSNTSSTHSKEGGNATTC